MASDMVKMCNNKGIATLMALVMLAIASGLATHMWYENQLSIARIQNMKQAYQAKHYSQGLLLWANDILKEDYAQDEFQHDTNNDLWLRGIQGMLVEDAVISGEIIGLNNRFNVNNLVINDSVSEVHLEYFRRLLTTLELDLAIADKVIDWIDTDQIPRPNGAENFIYLAKSPSYQTTSQYFKHIDEIALLDGMTPSDFKKLSPYISALPIYGQAASKMNINTMSPALLKALNLQITNEMSLRLYQEGRASFNTMRDFFQHESIRYVLTNSEVKRKVELLASVQTRDLQAKATIQMENQVFQMFALLRRNDVGVGRVISRSMGPYLTQTPRQ